MHGQSELRVFHTLTSEDVDDKISCFLVVNCLCKQSEIVFTMTRKLHEFYFLLFNALLTALVHKIWFLPLQNRVHIFTWPCRNILHAMYGYNSVVYMNVVPRSTMITSGETEN